MKILYLGSPEIAIIPLKKIYEEHEVLVVTAPSAPKGRGLEINHSPVYEFVIKNNLKVLCPKKAKDEDFLEAVKDFKPDLAITCAYGQILPKAFLSIPIRGTINIHPSLLPLHRGATPIQASLLAQDDITGVTILFTEFALDQGAIIVQKEFKPETFHTSADLHQILFTIGAELLPDALLKLQDPNFKGVEQDHTKATFCKKIQKEDAKIFWDKEDALKIVAKYKAYTPWPGLIATFDDKDIRLYDVSLSQVEQKLNPGEFIFDKATKVLIVGTIDKNIQIKKIQKASSKIVLASDFINSCSNKTKEFK